MDLRNRIYLLAAAALALLLLLAACSDPTPTPTVPPPVVSETVQLNADGSGDYASLPEAVAAVSPGAVIHLSAGTFKLASPLAIDKPLQLIGAGMNETEIVSGARMG
jgi:hypothetical protein